MRTIFTINLSKMKGLLLSILLSIVSQSVVFTQTSSCEFTLSGIVIDEHDQQALSYSTIYIVELEKGYISDINGVFVAPNLCNQTYTLVIGHIGCEPDTMKILITQHTKKTFYLEHHIEELKEFAIIENEIKPLSSVVKKELSPEELSKTRGRTLGESMKELTGVTTFTTGNSISKPVIHGMHSDRILILNNGIRQEGQQWGSEHAPEIDPFIANKLSVVKGAQSVRYGANAIGGVVLVEPADLPDSSGINGEINAIGSSNGQQGVSSAMLEGKSNKLLGIAWRVQGSLKKSGNVHTPNYFLKNTGVEEQNFSWTLGLNKEKYGVELFYSQFNSIIGIFSGAHIGNLTDLQTAFVSEEPLEKADFTYDIERPYQKIEHELFKVKSYVATGKVGKLELVYARQFNLRNEFDKHLPRSGDKDPNVPELKFGLTTHTGDLIWEHERVKKFKGSIGVGGIYQGNTTEGRNFIPNFIKYSSGIFWIENWTSNNYKLQIEGGVRYDKIYQQAYIWEKQELTEPDFNYENFSGTIGSVYKLTSAITLGYNFGSAWRPPGINELFSDGVHHGAAAVEIGDRTLSPEKAYNNLISVEYRAEKLLIQLEGYYNHIADYIYLAPELPPTLTIRGAFPTFRYKQTTATFKGVDTKVNYHFHKNVTYTGKVSLIRAFDETADEWLYGIPSDRFENGINFHVDSLKSLKNLFVGISLQHVLEQTRFEAGSDFVPPPKGYELLSLQAGLEIPLYKTKKQTVPLIIGMQINNLLNTTYRDYLNKFRYYSDEMGRNFILQLKTTF